MANCEGVKAPKSRGKIIEATYLISEERRVPEYEIGLAGEDICVGVETIPAKEGTFKAPHNNPRKSSAFVLKRLTADVRESHPDAKLKIWEVVHLY